MIYSIPAEHDIAFMQKAQAVIPGIHTDIIKAKKKAEQIKANRKIPRYVRRAYKSKSKKKINETIARAICEGFTKEEILADFKKHEAKKKNIQAA